jgi:single-strand DNA-binding protein
MNQLILMGHLITDPEMTYSANGLAITKFRMQTKNDGASEKPPDQHSIVVFGKNGDDGLAGRCAQFLHKGSLIALQGRHNEQEREGREGKKFLNCSVVAFNITFLDKIE